MIWRAPMGNIRRPSNSGSGGPETGAFIQFVNVWELQIYELWFWNIDRIWCEVCPTSRVEILTGNPGHFFTEYLIENGNCKNIIGEFLINGSVQFIGIYDIWGGGLPFIPNLMAQVEATGWGSISNNYNQSWGGSFTNTKSITNVPWGGFVDARPDYLPRRPVSPRVSRRRVCKYFLCCRRHQSLWRQYNRVFRWGWIRTSPMVRKLNNFPSKILFLVWLTVSGFHVRLLCVSLAVSVFNSYLEAFMVKLLIMLTSLSDLSSLSLVNVASAFSLCELDARLNASAVTLLVSVIDSSSSSIMTFSIASQIFVLDNGVLFLPLKLVMILIISV